LPIKAELVRFQSQVLHQREELRSLAPLLLELLPALRLELIQGT
jgi:hypothetical protein